MKSVKKNTTKREFSQILAQKFCKIWLIQMCVSLERKRNLKKNVFLRARFPVRRVFASSIPRNEMMTTYIMIYRYTLWKRKKLYWINILYNILENMFYFLVGYRCL